MKITQRINKTALFVAITSFTLGTLLLLLYVVSHQKRFVEIGALYTAFAFAVNAGIFIILIMNTIINYKYYKENLITLLLTSLNIPIALQYIEITEIIFYYGK